MISKILVALLSLIILLSFLTPINPLSKTLNIVKPVSANRGYYTWISNSTCIQVDWNDNGAYIVNKDQIDASAILSSIVGASVHMCVWFHDWPDSVDSCHHQLTMFNGLPGSYNQISITDFTNVSHDPVSFSLGSPPSSQGLPGIDGEMDYTINLSTSGTFSSPNWLWTEGDRGNGNNCSDRGTIGNSTLGGGFTVVPPPPSLITPTINCPPKNNATLTTRDGNGNAYYTINGNPDSGITRCATANTFDLLGKDNNPPPSNSYYNFQYLYDLQGNSDAQGVVYALRNSGWNKVNQFNTDLPAWAPATPTINGVYTWHVQERVTDPSGTIVAGPNTDSATFTLKNDIVINCTSQAPCEVTIAPGCNGSTALMNVNWSSASHSNDNSGYTVQRLNVTDGQTIPDTIATGLPYSPQPYQDMTVTAGKEYKYKVIGYPEYGGAAHDFGYSISNVVPMCVSTPTNTCQTTPIVQPTLKTSWSPYFGAVSYKVTRITSGGPSYVVSITPNTTFTDQPPWPNGAPAISSGNVISYKVDALDAQRKIIITYDEFGYPYPASSTSPQLNPVPMCVSVVDGCGTAFPAKPTITVSWSSYAGANNYDVLRGSTLVNNSNGTSYADTPLTAGNDYSYTVTAKKGTSVLRSASSTINNLKACVSGSLYNTTSSTPVGFGSSGVITDCSLTPTRSPAPVDINGHFVTQVPYKGSFCVKGPALSGLTLNPGAPVDGAVNGSNISSPPNQTQYLWQIAGYNCKGVVGDQVTCNNNAIGGNCNPGVQCAAKNDRNVDSGYDLEYDPGSTIGTPIVDIGNAQFSQCYTRTPAGSSPDSWPGKIIITVNPAPSGTTVTYEMQQNPNNNGSCFDSQFNQFDKACGLANTDLSTIATPPTYTGNFAYTAFPSPNPTPPNDVYKVTATATDPATGTQAVSVPKYFNIEATCTKSFIQTSGDIHSNDSIAFAPTPTPTPIPTIPNAPSNLTAGSSLTCNGNGANKVILSWTDNSNNEDNFLVQRQVSVVGSFATITTLGANITTYTDNSINDTNTYDYQVIATNGVGNSASTNTVSAPTSPITPTNLAAGTVKRTSVALSWTDNATDETGYIVNRRPHSTNPSDPYFPVSGTLGANVTSFTDTSVAPSTKYDYIAKSVKCNLKSGQSNSITVTTPS
ncbi:fibronectin type III domain-containing protein [Candidatus Daviesbacteria bacterium]|nr:fibronectin type III domain-containing protein [Candidatus Daviesbacteria bacterium]